MSKTQTAVSKRDQLANYLREQLSNDQTSSYFKSKNIAADLDLSSKEVGTNLSHLADELEDLTIEKWGRSTSTTWEISFSE